MAQFRKKPVVIEAFQLPALDADAEPFMEWAARVEFDGYTSEREGCMAIETLEGTMTAEPGDWIIKGIKGEFYPCKPDIFAASYESVSEPAAPIAAVEPTALPQDGDEKAAARRFVQRHANAARALEHMYTEKNVERLKSIGEELEAALASNKAAAVAARPTDDALWDQTLTERDNYHEWADKLANAIAEHFGVEIGEHSSANNPWSVALEALEDMVEPIAHAWRTTEPSVCAPTTEDPGVAALWREAGFDVIDLFESMPVAAAVAVGEPIYQVRIGDRWFDSSAAEYQHVTNTKRIVYATPPAPIASPSDAKPVARITSADEYGPILVWSTHWVDLIGRNLFTHPAATQPSRAEVLEEAARSFEKFFTKTQKLDVAYICEAIRAGK